MPFENVSGFTEILDKIRFFLQNKKNSGRKKPNTENLCKFIVSQLTYEVDVLGSTTGKEYNGILSKIPFDRTCSNLTYSLGNPSFFQKDKENLLTWVDFSSFTLTVVRLSYIHAGILAVMEKIRSHVS